MGKPFNHYSPLIRYSNSLIQLTVFMRSVVDRKTAFVSFLRSAAAVSCRETAGVEMLATVCPPPGERPSFGAFLGRARKVTRLPAGTGEVQVGAFILVQVNSKTGGSRPARRPTFCPSQQKVGKKWLSPGGGHSCRSGSEVPANFASDKRSCASWRGSNCPDVAAVSLSPTREGSGPIDLLE
jgi:hypothetical protein